MKKPLVSIIIPVFNNLRGLQKSINSIRQQTFSNYEVWIIKGDTNKETENYLQNLELPFRFISEKDNGIYDAMNKGIRVARGEWLYFLGSGDVFFNKKNLTNIFSNPIEKKYKIISGRVLYVGNNHPFIYNKNKREKKPSWSMLMWVRNGLHHQGTFYNKKLLKKNKYSLDYKILSDYYLNLLFFKKGYQCKLLNEKVSVCDSKGVSKQKKWDIYKEEAQLKRKISYKILYPFFYLISLFKFTISKF